MARIMGIDYGTKRTGIAVTDPLQLSVNGLATIATEALFDYLTDYLSQEPVERIVVGEPLHPDGRPAQIHHLVVGFVRRLKKTYPDLSIVLHDERNSSAEAREVIRQSGAGRKKRRDKKLVDKVSAVLILKDYLEATRSW